MPLNVIGLESDLLAMFLDVDPENPPTPQEAASAMAGILQRFVMSGTVAGSIVGASPSGPVTGTCTGTIS